MLNRIKNLFNADKLIYKTLLIFSLLFYFVDNYMNGLIKGGRWDLYQHIAMADRFIEGKGFYYSPVEASSPYFPGIAFFAVIVGKLFFLYRDYILLAIASLVGTLFLGVLIYAGNRNIKNNWISLLVIALCVLGGGFSDYKDYMNEFKGDSLVLLFAFMLVNLINYIEEQEDLKLAGIIAIFLIALCMDLTKQQALYVDIALGLYLLFSGRCRLKKRMIMLFTLGSAGILDLVILFSIPDIEISTMQNLKNMPWRGADTIILHMYDCLCNNFLFYVLLVLFVFLWIKKKVILDGISLKWFFVSLFFCLAQIAGGMKAGGNIGNYEAGTISFFPYTIYAANYIFEVYFAPQKKKRISKIVCCVLICMLICAFGRDLYYKPEEIISKVNSDRQISEYLSENAENKYIMYDSSNYMQIKRSNAKPGLDTTTYPIYVEEFYPVLENALIKKDYAYLYIDPYAFNRWEQRFRENNIGYEPHIMESLENNYELVEDPNMPEALKGQLYKVKE